MPVQEDARSTGALGRGVNRHVTPEDLPKRRLSFGHHRQESSDDAAASKKRRKSLFRNDDSWSDEEVTEQPATQAFEFTQCSDAEDDLEQGKSLFVKDAADGCTTMLKPHHSIGTRDVYSIGRDQRSSLLCSNSAVGRTHAELIHCQRVGSFSLQAYKECWILDNGKWKSVPAGSEYRIHVGQSFRVVPNSSRVLTTAGVQFSLGTFVNRGSKTLVGSASMDHEYLELLRSIKRDGQHQDNKKGGNITLREQVTLKIDLSCSDDKKDLLPITTLRKIYPMSAILEAVWYLRGENHVQFLQRNNQKFWDKQAKDDSWIGYNYGLLTTYPDADGNQINQLEENVLQPLVAGKSSRNMVCTLCKPGEETVQQACTSSVQFAVSGDNKLDLTVTQRSSDVILGLPNDVVVWSILVHLVRREVRLRTNRERELLAGTLNFCISAGGAHVYDINAQNLEDLLDREPISNIYPSLVVDDSCGSLGMLDLARSYDDDKQNRQCAKLRAAGYTSPHLSRMEIEQATDG